MLELHVSDKDISNSTIVLSWCIDQETLNYLKKESADPQLVVVVSPIDNYHPTKEIRKVIPLKDLIGFIEFKCAGINRIGAMISVNNRSTTLGVYLSKEHSFSFGGPVYYNTLLDSEGKDWSVYLHKYVRDCYGQPILGNDNNPILLVSDPIFVDVPKECFAPEPAQWEKTWVNHFFRQKVVDQCDFRRRRLFAYSIQPVIVAVNLFLRFWLVVLSFLFGCKGFSFKYLIHPLMYSLDDSKNVLDLAEHGSIFLRKLPDDSKIANYKFSQMAWYLVRKLWTLIFMPIIVLPFVFFLYKGMLLSVLFKISIFLGIALIVCLFIAFVVNIKAVGNFIINLLSMLVGANNEKLFKNSEVEEQDLLLCNGVKRTKLSDLPKQKRTIKLRFLDLKSKVCRPFSG